MMIHDEVSVVVVVAGVLHTLGAGLDDLEVGCERTSIFWMEHASSTV